MASPNTITPVIPILYEALTQANRELTGYIPAVTLDAQVARAAKDQVVRSPMGVAGTAFDIVPGVAPADAGGTSITYFDVTITKSRGIPIMWSGEEQLAVTPSGTLNKILLDQFTDAMRKLANEVELDLAICAKINASRAYGGAGTAPFGTAGDLSDIAGVLKILEDNGAPKSDLQLVLNTASMANLRGKQSVLFKVNEAGSSDMLRDGMTDRLEGAALRLSGLIGRHTKGTGASYATSGSLAIGGVASTLVTGTGTILPGDVISYAADTVNKYVVQGGVSAPGTITLGAPGAQMVIPTGNGLTVGNNYTPNSLFNRSALLLATRAPAMPAGGDMADDRTTITDPVSGLTFEVSIYRMYRQVKYEIALAWGVAAPNPSQIATLLG